MLNGKELKIERIKKDIQQQEVARELNVTKAYISMLEKGKQTIPKHIYQKWIDVLHIQEGFE